MDTVIQFRGTIYEKGYGMIAQKVMRDKDLPNQSRLIYAYMCSFASMNEAGERTAFPSIALQCAELDMSENTYYKWRKPLIEKGYITIESQKRKGKFDRNIYYIEAVPEPKSQNETTEKTLDTEGNQPYPKNSGTEKPYRNFSGTEKSCTENSGTNSISSNSISFKKEEEEINNARARNNIFYDVLQEFLQEKGLQQKTIDKTILELDKREIEFFTLKEVEQQLEHMVDKLAYGEVDSHRNWAVYFVNGLEDRVEQSQVTKQYQLEKQREYEIAMQKKRERAESFPYYNWLEA